MSEPQTNIEIEDVLSSIRRLVSQDLRRPQEPSARPVEAAELAPESAASRLDEVETLVLGPAQRVEAPEGLVPMPEGDEVPSEALDAVQRDEGPQEDWHEGAEAPMPPEEAAVSGDQPFAESEITAQEVQWDAPVGNILRSAREEESFEAFPIDDGVPMPRKDAQSRAGGTDEGEELAELETAFAQPEARLEPELGDPFGAAGLPASFEAEDWVDAEQTDYIEPEDYALEASEVPEATLAEGDAEAEMQMQIDAIGDANIAGGIEGGIDGATQVDAEEIADADLQADDIWTAEAGALGFSAEDEAERAREAAHGEPARGGMAHGTVGEGPREGQQRLHLSDATHRPPEHHPRRSTYDYIRAEVRNELQGEDEAENLLGGQRLGPNLAGLDEEGLRDMVREMIRQELQGVLGERITRNVRKLVRREIQRALDAEQF